MSENNFAGKKRPKNSAGSERASGDIWNPKRSRVEDEREKETDMPLELSVARFAESRALELEALGQAVEQVGGTKLAFQRLPRHMRRRAMSHNIRRVPRRLRLKVQGELEKREKKVNKRPSRRHRRRPGNLLSEYQRRQRRVSWLETHIWHAKRFKMTTAWGYRLPLHPSDKSLRACYRATQQHCLLQDVSFEPCIELKGPQFVILEALSHVTSKDTGLTFAAKATISGQRWGEVTMYALDSYPHGAVSPVAYLWRAGAVPGEEMIWMWCHPASYPQVWEEVKKACVLTAGGEVSGSLFKSGIPASETQTGSLTLSSLGSYTTNSSSLSGGETASTSYATTSTASTSSSYLTDWIDVLESLPCPSGGTEVRIGSLCMCSLKDQLVQFRLTGPASSFVLAEALKPASIASGMKKSFQRNSGSRVDVVEGTSKDRGVARSCSSMPWWRLYYAQSGAISNMNDQWSAWDRAAKCQSPAEVPPRAVIALTVRDPRLLLPPKPSKVAIDNAETSSDTMTWEQLPQVSSISPLWEKDVRHCVATSKMSEQALNNCRARLLIPGSACDLGDAESRIPVLLLQRPGAQRSQVISNSKKQSLPMCTGTGSGWDLVMPRSWGMAFWVALVYRGARAGGLSESRSLAMRTGVVHFPHDYPDTAAGERQALEVKQQLMEKHARRPPAKRCNFQRLGVPAPYHCPFSRLVHEWQSREDLSGASSSTLSSMDAGFYVLRCRKLLRVLSEVVQLSTSGRPSGLKVRAGVTKLSSLMGDEENQALVSQHMSSVVPVAVGSLLRGVPVERAMICLPTQDDLKQIRDLKKCPDFGGPIEHLHYVSSSRVMKAKKKHKKKKKGNSGSASKTSDNSAQSITSSKSQQTSTAKDYTKNAQEHSQCSKTNLHAQVSDTKSAKPEPSASTSDETSPHGLIDATDRTIIGFLTNGHFDFARGHAWGLGFCALRALLAILKQTQPGKPCLVLIRNTTSRQYRLAYLSILL